VDRKEARRKILTEYIEEFGYVMWLDMTDGGRSGIGSVQVSRISLVNLTRNFSACHLHFFCELGLVIPLIPARTTRKGGREEGREEGRKGGKKEGRKEGRKEARKDVDTNLIPCRPAQLRCPDLTNQTSMTCLLLVQLKYT
jgi:hypothetical protein